jgi:hypothetical protein
LDDFEKKYRAARKPAQPRYAIPASVSSEQVFVNDKKVIQVRFDRSKAAKYLNKRTDPRPRCSHYLGQFFMRNLQFNADTARVLHAHGAGRKLAVVPEY